MPSRRVMRCGFAKERAMIPFYICTSQPRFSILEILTKKPFACCFPPAQCFKVTRVKEYKFGSTWVRDQSPRANSIAAWGKIFFVWFLRRKRKEGSLSVFIIDTNGWIMTRWNHSFSKALESHAHSFACPRALNPASKKPPRDRLLVRPRREEIIYAWHFGAEIWEGLLVSRWPKEKRKFEPLISVVDSVKRRTLHGRDRPTERALHVDASKLRDVTGNNFKS